MHVLDHGDGQLRGGTPQPYGVVPLRRPRCRLNRRCRATRARPVPDHPGAPSQPADPVTAVRATSSRVPSSTPGTVLRPPHHAARRQSVSCLAPSFRANSGTYPASMGEWRRLSEVAEPATALSALAHGADWIFFWCGGGSTRASDQGGRRRPPWTMRTSRSSVQVNYNDSQTRRTARGGPRPSSSRSCGSAATASAWSCSARTGRAPGRIVPAGRAESRARAVTRYSVTAGNGIPTGCGAGLGPACAPPTRSPPGSPRVRRPPASLAAGGLPHPSVSRCRHTGSRPTCCGCPLPPARRP